MSSAFSLTIHVGANMSGICESGIDRLNLGGWHRLETGCGDVLPRNVAVVTIY